MERLGRYCFRLMSTWQSSWTSDGFLSQIERLQWFMISTHVFMSEASCCFFQTITSQEKHCPGGYVCRRVRILLFFPSKFRALTEKALWEEVSKSGFIAINWQLMGAKKPQQTVLFLQLCSWLWSVFFSARVHITEPGLIQNMWQLQYGMFYFWDLTLALKGLKSCDFNVNFCSSNWRLALIYTVMQVFFLQCAVSKQSFSQFYECTM